MTYSILTDLNGQSFRATAQQAEAIESLTEARKGGIATVYGYRPATNYITPPVLDLQVLTRFSTANLYRRKVAALESVCLNDVLPHVAADPVLSKLDPDAVQDLFCDRLRDEVDSLNKSLDGDRSDAHRAGHDRCYAHVTDGVKVHFVTERGDDGLMHPVLTDGLPTVNSIMVAHLELSRKVREAGERKVVNSRAPKRMGNAIAKVLNARSVGIRYLSLKLDNFDRVVVSRKSYLPEDVASIPADVLMA